MMEPRQPQHSHTWPGGSEGQGGGGGGSNRNSGSSTQSRFVEGSMNDRASAAPPPNFLGPNEVAAFERQFYSPAAVTATADVQDVGLGRGRQSFQHYPPRSNREFYQRRPLSSSGPSHRSSQPQLHTAQPQHAQTQAQPQPQLQTRKSGFLAPFLDGVREKLSLSRSKSSGSIGRVFSKDRGAAPPPVEEIPVPMENPGRPSITVTPGDTTGYPTREEVMESYKNLVASGFFQSHATQGTRHPPGQGGGIKYQVSAGPAVPSHTSHNPPASLKSFSQHLASAGAQNQRSPVPGLPYGANNQSGDRVNIPYGAPPQPQTRPPPPPAFMRPPRPEDDIPSPQRGTKRGVPDFNEIEASSTSGGPRKLVKKLRRSTSRASVDFNPSGSHSNTMTRPRPSTSSAAPPFVYLTKDTPCPSMSSNTNVPPPSSSGFGSSAAPPLASANNPFYVTPASFAPPPASTRTPPPKRKNKLMKLASSNRESTGRRIIGTLGFGGLRRVPSTSSKQPPPQLQPQAPPPVSRPTITNPAVAPAPTAAPPPVPAPAMLLPPAIIDDTRRSFGDTDTGDDEGDNYDSDAMVIDSPPPVVRQATMAKAMVAPAPSAFHYPQRQRTTRPLTASATTGRITRDIRTTAPSTSSRGESVRMLSSAASGEGAFNSSHGYRYESSSPNKKFVTTTALAPPPRMKSGKETTPTKNHVISKPMSPSNGNASSRDSGLGHGHGHGYRHSFDYDSAGGDDRDTENCPPPNVPTGPAGSSYVW